MAGQRLPLEARRALWRSIVAELLTPKSGQKDAAPADQAGAAQAEENGGRAAPPR